MNSGDIPKKSAGSGGRLFIMSAPSGAGKTTLCKAILERFPDMRYSVSFTTRNPRPGETEGEDYHFIDRETFQQRLTDNLWAEWARVHDHFYGTSAVFIENALAEGRDVMLDVDVQGALQLMERYPESVSIFIMPPSMEILKQRLASRGTDDPDEIEKRLFNAQKEIVQKDRYHYVIVNDRLSETIAELSTIIETYRSEGT